MSNSVIKLNVSITLSLIQILEPYIHIVLKWRCKRYQL